MISICNCSSIPTPYNKHGIDAEQSKFGVHMVQGMGSAVGSKLLSGLTFHDNLGYTSNICEILLQVA